MSQLDNLAFFESLVGGTSATNFNVFAAVLGMLIETDSFFVTALMVNVIHPREMSCVPEYW